jgi:hypothetical protein
VVRTRAAQVPSGMPTQLPTAMPTRLSTQLPTNEPTIAPTVVSEQRPIIMTKTSRCQPLGSIDLPPVCTLSSSREQPLPFCPCRCPLERPPQHQPRCRLRIRQVQQKDSPLTRTARFSWIQSLGLTVPHDLIPAAPTVGPSTRPTRDPTVRPTKAPTGMPTRRPSRDPTGEWWCPLRGQAPQLARVLRPLRLGQEAPPSLTGCLDLLVRPTTTPTAYPTPLPTTGMVARTSQPLCDRRLTCWYDGQCCGSPLALFPLRQQTRRPAPRIRRRLTPPRGLQDSPRAVLRADPLGYQ